MKKRIVCIFAHPDDESFGPGGTLIALAQDYDIYLICVTNGDNKDGIRKNEIKLGKLRKKELLDACKIIGIKDIFFLGYRDGSLSNNLYQSISTKVKVILEELKPSQLITFESRGMTGHTDHIVVSNISSYLFNKLSFIQSIWYFCIDINNRARMVEYFIFFPPGYKHSEIDKIVDVGQVWEKKLQAMYCHQSQKHDIDWHLRLSNNLPKEEYFLVVNK